MLGFIDSSRQKKIKKLQAYLCYCLFSLYTIFLHLLCYFGFHKLIFFIRDLSTKAFFFFFLTKHHISIFIFMDIIPDLGHVTYERIAYENGRTLLQHVFCCYLFIALGEQRCTFVLKTTMGIHRLTGKSELFRKPGK